MGHWAKLAVGLQLAAGLIRVLCCVALFVGSFRLSGSVPGQCHELAISNASSDVFGMLHRHDNRCSILRYYAAFVALDCGVFFGS